MRVYLTLACILVVALPSDADTSARRRKYVPWLEWSPGTWVRLRKVENGQEALLTMQMVSKNRNAAHIKGAWTVKGVASDFEYDHELNGPESDGVPRAWTKTSGGYETLEVAGRRLDCRWTVFEKLSGIAGKPGKLLTPEGVVEPEPRSEDELEVRRRRDEIDEWLPSFRNAVAERFGAEAAEWDESGGLRFSTNMSRLTYGSMFEWAERGGARLSDAGSEIIRADVSLPVNFQGAAEFACPFTPEPLRVASSVALRALIEPLAAAIERNPEWRELRATTGPTVSGDLAAILSARETVDRWLEICDVSIKERVPIVTE